MNIFCWRSYLASNIVKQVHSLVDINLKQHYNNWSYAMFVFVLRVLRGSLERCVHSILSKHVIWVMVHRESRFDLSVCNLYTHFFVCLLNAIIDIKVNRIMTLCSTIKINLFARYVTCVIWCRFESFYEIFEILLNSIRLILNSKFFDALYK